MKNFWGTFFTCLVICGVMLFFAPIFQNAWVLLAVSALVLTAPIRTLENQGDPDRGAGEADSGPGTGPGTQRGGG